jgi:voltage-gated potassium channel
MTPDHQQKGDGAVNVKDFGERYLGALDKFIKPLIWLSVILAVVEISPEIGVGGEHSKDGNFWTWFLWTERVIACLFTVEFVLRLIRSGPGKYVYTSGVFPYLHISPFAWIDIISVAPFWFGFFAPVQLLGYIRMMRVFRLLKFYRYSRTLQLNALAFYRAYNQLKGLTFQVFITSLFFTLMVYQAEHVAQPEDFANLSLSAWFTVVTSTTVGYGDRSPATVVGMLVVTVMMPIIIAQMGAALGIFGSCFQQVMDEERDPNVDPIALFVEERQNQRVMRKSDHDYTMKEDV